MAKPACTLSLAQVQFLFNPLSASITEWSNKFKQFVGKLPANCLSVSDYFVGLALKGLNIVLLRGKVVHVSQLDVLHV